MSVPGVEGGVKAGLTRAGGGADVAALLTCLRLRSEMTLEL